MPGKRKNKKQATEEVKEAPAPASEEPKKVNQFHNILK